MAIKVSPCGISLFIGRMAIKVIPLRDFLFIGRMAIKVSPQGFTSHTSAILLYGNTPVKAELAAGNRCGILRYGMVQWSLVLSWQRTFSHAYRRLHSGRYGFFHFLYETVNRLQVFFQFLRNLSWRFPSGQLFLYHSLFFSLDPDKPLRYTYLSLPCVPAPLCFSRPKNASSG